MKLNNFITKLGQEPMVIESISGGRAWAKDIDIIHFNNLRQALIEEVKRLRIIDSIAKSKGDIIKTQIQWIIDFAEIKESEL